MTDKVPPRGSDLHPRESRGGQLYFGTQTRYNRNMKTHDAIDIAEITGLIIGGELDDQLGEIETAVRMRRYDNKTKPMPERCPHCARFRDNTPYENDPFTGQPPKEHEIESAYSGGRTVGDFRVGDKVVFNSRCGTKYLVGTGGTVTALRRTKILVTPDAPIGRFSRKRADGTEYAPPVVVPTGIVDKVS